LLANRNFQRQQFVGGIVICLIGAICFSTKAIFVKLAYRDTSVDAVTLLALRMIFSLPFFVVSAAISSQKSDNVKFTLKQWMYVALIGSLGYYVSSLLDFLGLQYVSAGIERLILFVYPTFVLIMSALIFKARITRNQWIAVGITYAGLVTAFAGEISIYEDRDSKFYLGAFYIFACAITYAMYLVGSGRVIPQVGAAKFNSYAMSFACLGVLLHFFIVNDNSLLLLPTSAYAYGIAMAIVSTVVPSYLVTEGIKRIGSDNAAIAGSVGPVSTIMQAFIFLHEPIFATQIIGTMLVLIGVLLISKRSALGAKTSASRL
jgi:drug/metabolite transporter (DMT)-like permease